MVEEKFNLDCKIFVLILVCFTLIAIIALRITCEVKGLAVTINNSNEHLAEPTKTVELNSIPISFSEIQYEQFFNIDLCNDFLNTVLYKDAQELAVAINSNEYTEEAVASMKQELSRLQTIIEQVEADVSRYTVFEQEYYYAAKIWEYFKQLGYSDAVACGIIGNMMIETASGTLDLHPTIYSPGGSFYGLCQWALVYSPSVAGLPFEEQLDYLIEDMPSNFATFGFCYTAGFTFEDFLALEDPGAAAIAFAKIYERCASGSYALRSQAALNAYSYFCAV